MCSVAAAALVVGVVSAVGTAVQQDQQQKSQVRYQNRVTEITQQNAAKAAAADYVATAERAAQVRQASAQEAFEASRSAEKARSTLAVGAAAAGLEGVSIDDLSTTIAIQAAEDAAIRQRNLDWQDAQILRSMERIQVDEQNRANSRYLPAIPGVDYAGLLGRLAQSGVAYANSPSST